MAAAAGEGGGGGQGEGGGGGRGHGFKFKLCVQCANLNGVVTDAHGGTQDLVVVVVTCGGGGGGGGEWVPHQVEAPLNFNRDSPDVTVAHTHWHTRTCTSAP